MGRPDGLEAESEVETLKEEVESTKEALSQTCTAVYLQQKAMWDVEEAHQLELDQVNQQAAEEMARLRERAQEEYVRGIAALKARHEGEMAAMQTKRTA